MAMLVEVARVGDLMPGELRSYKGSGYEIMLARVDDHYYAADDCCPKGDHLSRGKLVGTVVTCPGQHYRFDLAKSRVLGLSPFRRLVQAPKLRGYAIEVKEGRIMVDLPPLPSRKTPALPRRETGGNQPELIRQILAQHSAGRAAMRLKTLAKGDLAESFGVQTDCTIWSIGSPEALVETRDRIYEALGTLEEALEKHYALEDAVFPAAFGEELAGAFFAEHEETGRRIKEIKATADNLVPERLSEADLVAKRTELRTLILDLDAFLEQHADREDKVLLTITGGQQEGAGNFPG